MSALSLTFDDGLPVQVEYAIPELNQRNIPATFFVIQNSPYGTFDKQAWKDAVAKGHEVGAHSVNHLKPAELSELQARSEVRDCKAFLEREIGCQVTSYAYPYTHVIEPVKDEVSRHYKQARGGRVARDVKPINRGDGADFLNLPCHHVGPNNNHLISMWLDEAMSRDAWLILMFHGIGPDETQWDNLKLPEFERLLDVVTERRERGLQVLPMGTAANLYR